MALAAYRNLLRATRIAFQEDHALLHAARAQARSGFDKARSLSATSSEAQQQIEHALGVSQVLRENVVQGKREGDVKEQRYKLRIHEETERGDNDTVKNPRAPGGKVKVGMGGCG